MKKGTIAFLSGVVGAAVGAATAYVITKKVVTKKKQAECDAQVESVVNAFRKNGYTMDTPASKRNIKEKENEDISDLDERPSKGPNIAYKKVDTIEREYSELANKYSMSAETEDQSEDDFIAHSEPYEISESEFINAPKNYTSVHVSYNAYDNKFYDEDGDPMDNFVIKNAGEAIIERFTTNRDSDGETYDELQHEIFVKNDETKIVLSITKDFFGV